MYGKGPGVQRYPNVQQKDRFVPATDLSDFSSYVFLSITPRTLRTGGNNHMLL